MVNVTLTWSSQTAGLTKISSVYLDVIACLFVV